MTNSEMIERLNNIRTVVEGLSADFKIPSEEVKEDMKPDIEALSHAIDLLEKEDKGEIVRLPCKMGDTVYVITDCVNVAKDCDDDYITGTGAITCPFEKSCLFEECDDANRRIFETRVRGIWIDEDGLVNYFFDHIIDQQIYKSDFGKTVFLTREEAEKALKGEQYEVATD